MATLAELYAYEDQIEPAWAAILINRGVNAFIEFSSEHKETPYVDISIVHVEAVGHQKIISANPEVLYWDAWEGQLHCRIYTERGKNSDQQPDIMGTVRAAAVDFWSLFTPANLPFHVIKKFREAEQMSANRGYDKELNLDWSELRFDLAWSIRTSQW